jgi:hypothetical protein
MKRWSKRQIQAQDQRAASLLESLRVIKKGDPVMETALKRIADFSRNFCQGLDDDTRAEAINMYAAIVVNALGDNREAANALLNLIQWVAIPAAEWQERKDKQATDEVKHQTRTGCALARSRRGT